MEVDTNVDNADPLPKGLGSENKTIAGPMPTGGASTITSVPVPTGHRAEEYQQPGSAALGNSSGQCSQLKPRTDQCPDALTPSAAAPAAQCTGHGFNPNLYNAIKKLRMSTMLPRQVGTAVEMPALGSFVSSGVANKDMAYYRHIFDNKINISFSFEPRCLMCHCNNNGPHHILGDTYQPVCIILLDQCFPAALPATKPGLSCPIIIRVEDGTLGDLLSTFRKTIGKVKLPVGSLITICSLSHLARVGAAAYAADLQQALASIEEDYGNRIRAAHGVPLPVETLEDMSTARALWDVLDWIEAVDKRAKYTLPDTVHALKEACLLEDEMGGEMSSARLHMRLPAGFRTKDTAAFMLGGCCRLSGAIKGVAGRSQADLVQVLAAELNSEFAVNVDPKPDLAAGRVKDADSEADSRDAVTLLVAGGSHASRLVAAMEADHPNIIDITRGGWKLDEGAAMELAAELEDHLDGIRGKAVVIVQLFDNCIYHGILPDGSRRRPFKSDGVYHVEGELATIGKAEMRELFDEAAPIFRAAKNHPTIVLGPVPRYQVGGCCRDPTHITNIEDADYGANQAGAVRELGRNLRQLVWHKRWRNVTVINTSELMGVGGSYSIDEAAVRLQDLMKMWDELDPVHPTETAYKNLAKATLDLARAKAAMSEDTTSANGEEQRGVKRPREEPTGRRPEWTLASATAVSRRGSGAVGRGGHRGESRGAFRWHSDRSGYGEQSSSRQDSSRGYREHRERREQRGGGSSYGGGSGGRGEGRGGRGRRDGW